MVQLPPASLASPPCISSSHPSHSGFLVVLKHNQSILALGPLHMLFTPQSKLFLLQVLILALSHACAQFLLLSQVFLMCCFSWEVLLDPSGSGWDTSIISTAPCLSQIHGPPSTGNKLEFSITTLPGLRGGLSWVWFSSSKSLLGKLSPNTGRCLGAGPSIFLRQKHDFLASFNSSNVFKSKHIQHQLLLL